MQKITFFKYHGTGNDFVIIDNRDKIFDSKDTLLVKQICHRRFGVGADGFMLLENSEDYNFAMRYYNSDGNEGTMCGNGGRCIVAFAHKLGLVPTGKPFTFEAIDGLHEAVYSKEHIRLKMIDVNGIQEIANGFFLNTGSPHFVRYTEDLEAEDVFSTGRSLRNNTVFGEGGSNVNFVSSLSEGTISVRTYERGVEDETWSCGTGCVASALTDYYKNRKTHNYKIMVRGGQLKVQFTPTDHGCFKDVWLEGPVAFVFQGEIYRDEVMK
jgi:diaminopimelate epimerase